MFFWMCWMNYLFFRISRELEDSVWIKFVNTTNRKLYFTQILELSVDDTADIDQKSQPPESQVALTSLYQSKMLFVCPS